MGVVSMVLPAPGGPMRTAPVPQLGTSILNSIRSTLNNIGTPPHGAGGGPVVAATPTFGGLIANLPQQLRASAQPQAPQQPQPTLTLPPITTNGSSSNGLPGISDISDTEVGSGESAVASALQQAAEARAYAGLGGTAGGGGSSHFTVPQVNGGLSVVGFAKELLQGLGIRPTANDISDMVRWEDQEGGNFHNDASFNPLNTTMAEPGYHTVGTQGNIGAYQSWEQGLKATLATLASSRYSGIINALRNNASLGQFESAVSSSPWGTHF